MFKWAVDGVGAVVHPDNPVDGLSRDQIKAVFAGRIDNWKQVGGPEKAINKYTRDESSGTRAVFWKKALDKGAISAKANVVVSNGAMKSAIANDPYAIGYVSVGHIDDSVKPVAIDGIKPTLETVRSGTHLSPTCHRPRLRARAKITSHFCISASAHLWPMPHSQNPRNRSLFLWFCYL